MKQEERRELVLELLGPDLVKKYESYIDVLVRGRQPPKGIADAVNDMEHVDAEIAAGRCPECGSPIARYGAAETHKLRKGAGLSDGPRVKPVGGWVMYRCSTQTPPAQPARRLQIHAGSVRTWRGKLGYKNLERRSSCQTRLCLQKI